jgi:uncharacterized protein
MGRSGLALACVVGALTAISADPGSAQSAPPWCNTSGRLNPAERTICHTPALWSLDDTLNLSYAFARDRLSGAQRRQLEASQTDWLRATRDACETDVRCLAREIRNRSNTLDDINNRGRL